MGMQEDIELAGLSEEEIEALKDEDGDIPPDDPDIDDDGDGELELENKADVTDDNSVDKADTGAAPPAGDDKAEPQKGEDDPPAKSDEKETPSTSEPSFDLKAEEDKKKLEEIQAELEKNEQDFDDGQIDFTEYRKALARLIEEKADLRIYKEIDNKFAQIAEAKRKAQWEAAKQSFRGQNPEIMGYSSRVAGYEAILQELIQSEDGQKMNDAEILDAAREKFYEENPQIAPRQQEKAVGKDNLRSNVDKLKAGQKRQVRTLANIPVADANDTGNSEFAHLDNLPPEKLEKALEGMSGAEMERYLEAP